jgi:hypothetical protein
MWKLDDAAEPKLATVRDNFLVSCLLKQDGDLGPTGFSNSAQIGWEEVVRVLVREPDVAHIRQLIGGECRLAQRSPRGVEDPSLEPRGGQERDT